MIKKRRAQLYAVIIGLIGFSSAVLASGGILDPKGIVTFQERQLMFDTVALMLVVVLPVIIMSFAFAYRYRRKKHIGQYRPDWSHNGLLELFWWGIPTLIIIILGVILWHATHKLDPYRKLDVPGPTETIEVVALRWKWLFIYPDEHIATINDLYLPVNKQVQFLITADGPMSAFDIPQLIGQIYAMAGMRTRQHLYSSYEGVYDGLNTQLNGDGFSYMHFPVHVASQADFDSWVNDIQGKANPLTLSKYSKLYEPDINAPAQYYSDVPQDLFNKIMMQYMMKDKWLHQW